jgi:tripartite ATP-independent transporter DctM subunit
MFASGIVFGFLLLFIFLGIEIPMTLGMATFFAIQIVKTPMDVASLVQSATTILPDSVTLIAIPLFVLTGSLISNSLIAPRLVSVANAVVGKRRGGLAVVNVISAFIFGGISGSAAADAASIGGVMIPMMVKYGYPKDFCVALTATTSTLGPIVPPSIIMIVFGYLTNTPISALFVAGYLPGMVVALAQIGLCIYLAHKNKYPVSEGLPRRAAVRTVLVNLAIVSLPFLIIGGIVSGIFTPTEAGGFGALYSIVIMFFYRGLKDIDIRKVLSEVVGLTGMCCFLLAFASVFARFLTYTKSPELITDAIMPYVSSPAMFLVVVVLIWLFLGCIMNPVAALTMTLPVLFPISQEYQIHPLHLGMVATVALAIGHVTPPVGISLFIGCSIGKVTLVEVLPMLVRFIIIMVLACLILIWFPAISLWLPTLLGYA